MKGSKSGIEAAGMREAPVEGEPLGYVKVQAQLYMVTMPSSSGLTTDNGIGRTPPKCGSH